MSWTEITVLVERAKAGDREAYGELVTRFQSSVYAMALARVRNPLEAQELAQDVFVHAMRKLPQLRDPRCFAGWLRRITARMAINRLTRRGPLFGADPEMLDAVQAQGRTAGGGVRRRRGGRAAEGRAGAAEAAGPADAGGVLHPGPEPEADRPGVRGPDRDRQAAAARRPAAAEGGPGGHRPDAGGAVRRGRGRTRRGVTKSASRRA